jgi:penicillin-binding protein 1C
MDGVVRSSIDGTMQHAVEALTHRHVERLRLMGITNASVIVVDNATRRVVSYVGSADPSDVQSLGQVDGIRAIRSPGSTLKPFIYALAVDRGLMTPRTMLEDVPVSFDGYAPENFDRTYMGAMTMERALATSRNIPAVATLERIGIASLLDMLQRADVRSVARQRTGLSIALGGCGMQLDELVGLYAALANGGLWSPLAWSANAQQHDDTIRLMSRPAAYMISEVLTTASRPDLPNGVDVSADLPRIAWKTGTSYGRRDAWSIGYNRRYTIGVWVGNFNGSGNEMLTGSQCATPLLFDVFRSIDHSMDDRWLERPAVMDMRFVCAMSGLPPADSCTNQMLDAFIPGVSIAERCRHQREMYVDNSGRRSFCTSCLPQTGWIRRMELDMPAPVLAYMRDNGVALRMPPPHDPQCTRVFEGSLSITAPSDGKEYVLERGVETKLRCTANAESDVSTVYWFLDDVFVTSTPAGHATFITPASGRHILECVDDRGRRTQCRFTVRYW